MHKRLEVQQVCQPAAVFMNCGAKAEDGWSSHRWHYTCGGLDNLLLLQDEMEECFHNIRIEMFSGLFAQMGAHFVLRPSSSIRAIRC